MKYKLLLDSGCDYNDTILDNLGGIERIPLYVTIDGKEYADSGNDVHNHLKMKKFITRTIRTACPSPGDFYKTIKDAKDSFIVTLSSSLSGSFQSAKTAKDMLEDTGNPVDNIHIIDSKSSSAGTSLVALRLKRLIDDNIPTAQIIENINRYISGLKTLFVINSFDTLVSNGRVSMTKQLICNTLNIVPVMGSTPEGKIEMKSIARGKAKAISKLIDMLGSSGGDLKDKVLGISHVNAEETVNELIKKIKSKYNFKEIHVFEMSGINTVYAGDGGIVVAC